MEKEELLIMRKELIMSISARSKLLRTELNIKQDELAIILGISKNTIVNVEKDSEDETKCYSWPVVISIVILFSHTDAIKQVLNGETAIELVSKYAFVLKSKRNILYNSTILGITNSLGAIPGIGGAILNMFNKPENK